MKTFVVDGFLYSVLEPQGFNANLKQEAQFSKMHWFPSFKKYCMTHTDAYLKAFKKIIQFKKMFWTWKTFGDTVPPPLSDLYVDFSENYQYLSPIGETGGDYTCIVFIALGQPVILIIQTFLL